MIMIIDANIIFSAVVKPSGKIGNIIFSEHQAMLIAPRFLKDEIEEHKQKIIKITGKSEEETDFIILTVFNKITFYSEEIIPNTQLEIAIDLVADIDPDDFI